MGLLARFFKGGLTIPDMMRMKYRQDIKKWYDIYILQSVEEEVIIELKYDKDGKEKKLPHPRKIREIVLKRIEERKKESEEYLNSNG